MSVNFDVQLQTGGSIDVGFGKELRIVVPLRKGLISEISADGRSARVTPYDGGFVTPFLAMLDSISTYMQVNTPVVYALFPDGTGIILARMDGMEITESLVIDAITDANGNVVFDIPDGSGIISAVLDENGNLVVEAYDNVRDVKLTEDGNMEVVYV